MANHDNQPKPEEVRLLRIKDVLERLRISRSKLYEEIQEGRLQTLKIGSSSRIRSDDLDQYINKLTPKSALSSEVQQ